MKASELITRKSPIVIKVGSPVMEAIKLMADNNVGLVVIVDSPENKKVLGVISERDVIRALAKGIDISKATVEQVGTMGNIVSVKYYDYITTVARLMNERQVRHVVVIDDDNRVVSVISIRDLLKEKEVIDSLARLRPHPPVRE
ncbi:CBS domain-containing protein [Caldivirga maquilingensis]|uniref:Putative signal-transduction protein with CBS domains n=1 Tax=Caldivirga maquilingensis (strain ATCC 700844 / DSM 13496 / JCM 10307 / IC-167) TaxID=397948 RepID=A8MCF9_CALMQ|nr:CBS domain-containing protein [Caldivirga maquilingensis]ABW01465.1 putative signal-transduction protein with CBS domains [Caldivirga maquilingensis IC-167]